MKLGIVSVAYLSSMEHLEMAAVSCETLKIALKKANIDHYWVAPFTHQTKEFTALRLAHYIPNPQQILIQKENCLSQAWNDGIEVALEEGCDYILIPNLDIVAHPLCIKELLEFAACEKDAILWTGSEVDSIWELDREKFEEDKATSPHFSFFMIKNDFIKRLAPKDPDKKNKSWFDTDIKPAYFEDCDMHYRIRRAGFTALRTTASRFYHYGSGTLQGDSELEKRNQTTFESNKEYYIAKWGGMPDKEKFTIPFNQGI